MDLAQRFIGEEEVYPLHGRYPWHVMERAEYFVTNRWAAVTSAYRYARVYGKKFSAFKHGDMWRVYRIE